MQRGLPLQCCERDLFYLVSFRDGETEVEEEQKFVDSCLSGDTERGRNASRGIQHMSAWCVWV